MKNLNVFLLATMIATTAHAGKGRDGGNLAGLYRKSVEDFISNQLKQKLITLSRALRPENIQDLELREMVKVMKDGSLFEDITNSEYKFALDLPEGKCVDSHGEAKMATTVHGEKGSMICFDSVMISKSNGTTSNITALAMHEHAHHFGYHDEDGKLTKYITHLVDFNSRSSLEVERAAIQNLAKEIAPYVPGYVQRCVTSSACHNMAAKNEALLFWRALRDNFTLKKVNKRTTSNQMVNGLSQFFYGGRNGRVDKEKIAEFLYRRVIVLPKRGR